MRHLLIALMLCSPLWAVTNTVTHYEVDNASQSNTHFRWGRVFAQGEITTGNCPRPSVGGTPLTTYESLVLNTWSDGSVKMAIGAYDQSFTALQNKAVTFVSDASCSNSGGLTTAQMTNFTIAGGTSGDWDFTWTLTPSAPSASAAAVTISAKAILALFDPHSFSEGSCKNFINLDGPVMTEVIIEDCTSATAADVGWHWDGANSISDGVHTSYTGNSQYAANHPWAILRFWRSTQTIEAELHLENEWDSRFQDQPMSLVIKGGLASSLTTLWSSTSAVDNTAGVFDHVASTDIPKHFYIGTQNGHTRTDPNFVYLTSTKMFPNADQNYAADPTISGNPCGSSDFCTGYPSWVTLTDFGEINGSGNMGLWGKSYGDNPEGSLHQRELHLHLYNTAAARIQLIGGGGGGAAYYATVSGGVVQSATKITGGSGYTGTPTCTVISYNGGSGATCTATRTGDAITSVAIGGSGGSGYLGCGKSDGACAKTYQMLTGRTADGDTTTSAGIDTVATTAQDVVGGAGMWGNMGNIPYHLREGYTSGGAAPNNLNNFYCPNMADKNATTVNGATSTCTSGVGTAQGRPNSRHANVNITYKGANSATTSFTPVGSVSYNGWQIIDTSHWQAYSGDWYELTGSYGAYREMLQEASYALDSPNGDAAFGDANGFFGVMFPNQYGARLWAWGMLPVGLAAALARDSTVEQSYYTSMVNSNLQFIGGVLGDTSNPNITPTSRNPTCASYILSSDALNRWNWGRCTGYSLCGAPTNCSAASDHSIANTQYNFSAGGSTSALAWPQTTISTCTNANPAVCTLSTSVAANLASINTNIWGATGNFAGTKPLGINSPALFWGASTVNAANKLNIVGLNSTGFGAWSGTAHINFGMLNQDNNTETTQDWMMWGALEVLGRLNEMGLTNTGTILSIGGKRLLEQLQDPGFVPGMAALYATPAKNSGPYANWADTLAGITPSVAAWNSFHTSNELTGNFAPLSHSYSNHVRAAASFLVGNITPYTCPGGGTCDPAAAWTLVAVTNTGAIPLNNNTQWGTDPNSNSTLQAAGSQVRMAYNPRDAVTVASCAISPSSATISTGGTQTYTSVITWSDASTTDGTATLSLSSGTPSVATVSGQTATGVSGGSSTITGTNTVSCGTSALTVNAVATGSGASTGVFTGVRH